MIKNDFEFERFSNREGFNRSLIHFKKVMSFLGDLDEFYNLADLLNEQLADSSIEQSQIAPIIQALLVDKFGYAQKSLNLQRNIEDFTKICTEIQEWNSIDMVIVYYHPQLGVMAINPKNINSWQAVQSLKKNELVNVYAGAFGEEVSANLTEKALKAVNDFFASEKVKKVASLKKGEYAWIPLEEEEEEPVVSPQATKETKEAPPQKEQAVGVSKSKRMTPLYSVPVTNELFHNGNVEAWKKIIQSYTTKNPGLEVYIFYDNERIQDIHALFKWGKVKNGSSILFAVAGEEIRDVAKLQRYLKQGASPKFEDFLRFPVNKVLNLF